MPLTTLSADYLLDQWGANKALYLSAHTAYSASGGNELTGGSPAYARLLASWSSASANSKALAGTPYNFNVPGATTVAFIGFWDSLTGGNFQDMIPAGNATGYTFAAPSSTSILLAPGSGYAANQQVCVFNTGGSAIPSGLVAGTIYFVKSPSSDSFQLAATSGGSAITLTGDGSGYVQAITPEVFAGAGTFTVTAGSVSLV